MDRTRDKFGHGRQGMLAAFVELSDLARQAGIDFNVITDLHGRFFDGNMQVKQAFGAAVLMAEIWRPRARLHRQRRNAPRPPFNRP